MQQRKKILLFIICVLLQSSSHAFAQENLSPAITLSNQAFQDIIQNSILPKQSETFLKKRPLDWEQRRNRMSQHWPKRSYNKAEFNLEEITEDLMVYPKAMLNSPDLFNDLDSSDPGIAYDKKHFKFNYQTGYWHSKDFPNLVLGTWEDVEKKFSDNSYIKNTRSKMKRHVVTRYKNPNTNKTISFYFFDNHAYSVPYALEAKQRNELPNSIDHIVVDQHSDNMQALPFEFPQTLAGLQKLLENDYIAMNSFHSVFGRLNMFSRLIWIFDGNAKNCTSRAKSVNTLKKNMGCAVKGICMSEYPNLSSRPKNSPVFLNIDVDTTDQMLELDSDQDVPIYNRIVQPEETLYFYTDFILQLIKNDDVDIASFQASTTNWFKRDDGDVETTRFLSRIAPAIILQLRNTTEQELKEFIDNTIDQHKKNLIIGQRLKDKLKALSQSEKNNHLGIASLNLSVNQSI